MTVREDPRLMEAKAISMREMVDRLGIAGLRPAGNELVGPCPLCGGRDRFGINLRSNAFLCRKCDLRGGDQVALTMGVLGMDFRAALQWICGDAPAEIDAAELERRRKRAAEVERKQREAAERYRAHAIRDARTIWAKSRPGSEGVVRAYLAARGLGSDVLPVLPGDLHFIARHPYVKKIGGQLVTAHTGPAMIAAVRRPDGAIMAAHQTWIDPAPPHGKAQISQEGESLPAKMVRGSKKGGAVRLFTPERFDTLVMGEGIETTLTAAAAWGRDLDPVRTAYWAGVDLGNMSGRMQGGKGMKYAGLPDMGDAEAFVPPPWIRRLIFIQDGDSNPRATRARLLSGLRRAMAHIHGLRGQIVHAGDGVDLNDVLTGARTEEGNDGQD